MARDRLVVIDVPDLRIINIWSYMSVIKKGVSGIIGMSLVALVVVLGLTVWTFLPVRDGGPCNTSECRYDLSTVKKKGADGPPRAGVSWLKPSLSNVTALAVGRHDEIYVGAMTCIEVLDPDGVHLTIPMPAPVRALAEKDTGDIFVGLDNHVEIFSQDGIRKAVWKRPDPKTMITSIAVSSNFVFVADCQNRVVWRFSLSGEVLGRIGDKSPDRPEGFVVPSAFFDVAVAADDSLWIVNPGMHRVEHFTSDGAYLTCWGAASLEPNGFCGCCNPSNLALAPDGSFITSEKHIVRVKRYDTAGRFLGIISGQEEWGSDVVGLDLAVDSKGRILVLDPSADAVRVYSALGAVAK